MLQLSNKVYITLFVILFAVSTGILLIASTAQAPVPAWAGYLDVAIVLLIAFAGFMVYQRSKSAPRYEASYQIAIYLFPLLVVGMWLFRESLDFNVLLPGVAWRTYFFLSFLPHILNIWKSEHRP